MAQISCWSGDKVSIEVLLVLVIVQGLGHGIVDGSASKPALRQDTGYMVEKTYTIFGGFWGLFKASVTQI